MSQYKNLIDFMLIQALIFYILFSIIKTDSRDYLKNSIEKAEPPYDECGGTSGKFIELKPNNKIFGGKVR